MNNLDIDLTANANIDRQSVRITAGNGSPLEYAYTLVYLLSLSGSVGLIAATFTAVIALYSLRLEWGWVLLMSGATMAVITAVTHLLIMVSLSLLISTYGSNNQPRDDDGRFIPVYQSGGLMGHIFTKNRRKTAKKRDSKWGGGVWVEQKNP